MGSKQFLVEDKVNYKDTFIPLISELISQNVSFTCYVEGLKMIRIEPNYYKLKITEDILAKYPHLEITTRIREFGRWVRKSSV